MNFKEKYPQILICATRFEESLWLLESEFNILLV